MTNVQIANTLINAGAYVDLQCTSFKWSFKRLNRTEPVIGQNPANTTDGELDIPQGDEIGGVEAPVLTITGSMDTETYATDNAFHAISSITIVTLGYLKELARIRSSGVTTLQIYFGMDNVKEFRSYDGGGISGTSKRTITVLIEALDVSPLDNSEGLHLINFQLQCREVRSG